LLGEKSSCIENTYVNTQGSDANWTGLDRVTTNYSVEVVANLSSLSWPPPLHPYTTLQIGLISLVVAVLSVVTTGANLMVIISFRMDRQLSMLKITRS